MDSLELLKSHVDAYTRKDGAVVQAHDDKRVAASKAPPIATHAAALAASSKPGDLDHEDNQTAAGYMKDGDHKALASHIKNLDTAARDHILDHVHPDHREGLGFKQLNMERSQKQYAEKFPDKKPVPKGRGFPKQHTAESAKADSDKARAAMQKLKEADDKPAPITKTQNEGNGFHGEAFTSHFRKVMGDEYNLHNAPEGTHAAAWKHADKQFSDAAHHLVKNGHFKDHEQARKFLDSRDGRHLHNETNGDVSKSKWVGQSTQMFRQEKGW